MSHGKAFVGSLSSRAKAQVRGYSLLDSPQIGVETRLSWAR